MRNWKLNQFTEEIDNIVKKLTAKTAMAVGNPSMAVITLLVQDDK